MIGFPPVLNTKVDYEYIRDHFPEGKWQPHFQALLDTKDNFFFVKTLKKYDVGIKSATEKVVKYERADGLVERIQLELKPDPNSKLLAIGFNVTDVEETISANSYKG